jgi:glycosyltransferase involved in cell wall biosynthesis
MASGLPVIATRVGGNLELVVEGANGEFFAPRDVQALTSALAVYAVDEARRRAHGEQGRRRALEHFSLDGMVERYLNTYDALLGRARPALAMS